MSFVRIYLRVLGLLRPEARLAVILALANIALAVRNSSSRCCSAASSMPCPARCPRPRAGRPRAGAADRRLGRVRAVHHRRRRAGRLVRRPAGAPAPQPGAGGLFRARLAAAARLSFRRAFRPADEGHAHRHRYAVVAVGVVLPRAFRRLRLHRVLLPATLVLNWRLALPLLGLCVGFTALTMLVMHKADAPCSARSSGTIPISPKPPPTRSAMSRWCRASPASSWKYPRSRAW
jgi:hypothetical protein